MSQTTHRPAWTRSEKALIGGSIAVVIIGITSITALRHQEELPHITIHTPQMPSPNAFDYFTKAGSAVVDETKIGYAIGTAHSPPTSSDDHSYTQAEKESLVRENTPALKTVRQGFAYPYFNPPTRSFSTLLPYYAKDRGLARLLRLEAQTRIGRGDWGGAANSSLDAVQEGEMIPHGSVLIGSLVGIACEAIGRKTIWQATDHLTAADARNAALRLERINANEVPFAQTMQEEKWLGQAGLLEVLQKSNWRQRMGQMYSSDDTDAARGMEARLLLMPKRRILDRYTAYMDNAISNAHRPYAAVPQTPATPSDPFIQMFCPDLETARTKSADNQTQNA